MEGKNPETSMRESDSSTDLKKWTALGTGQQPQDQGGHIWDLIIQTMFRRGLGSMWPHSFSSVYTNVSLATLQTSTTAMLVDPTFVSWIVD